MTLSFIQQKHTVMLITIKVTLEIKMTNVSNDCFDSVFNLGQFQALPGTCNHLASASANGPVVSRVINYT